MCLHYWQLLTKISVPEHRSHEAVHDMLCLLGLVSEFTAVKCYESVNMETSLKFHMEIYHHRKGRPKKVMPVGEHTVDYQKEIVIEFGLPNFPSHKRSEIYPSVLKERQWRRNKRSHIG